MDRHSIAEGGLSTSLLEDKPRHQHNDVNGCEVGKSSSATSVVVFSSFVAVCGSYVFGSAVCTYLIHS